MPGWIAGPFYLTPHAVRRYQERLAPHLDYDAAKAALIAAAAAARLLYWLRGQGGKVARFGTPDGLRLTVVYTTDPGHIPACVTCWAVDDRACPTDPGRPRGMLSVAETAAILGCRPSTVRGYTCRGVLPSCRVGRRRWIEGAAVRRRAAPDPSWMPAMAAAAQLGYSPTYLRQLLRLGVLPARRQGRAVYVAAAAVDRALAARAAPPGAAPVTRRAPNYSPANKES